MSSSEQFHGYAALERGTHLKQFSYTPRPLGDEDVQIRITHCGMCASDIHQMTAGWGSGIFPMVPGHEIVGKVEAIGPKVQGLKIGDRVGVGPNCWSCRRDDCRDCHNQDEPLCPKKVDTYNDRYPDGVQTFGGYCDRVRVLSHFVFPIPDALSSAGAAPLLCAGVTTFTPFVVHNVGKGAKVGVLGIGGLGHLGLQWAKALGCEVWALSSSDSKEAEARSLGSDHYININKDDVMNAHERKLDFILATGNDVKMDWGRILKLLRSDGHCCLVGIPETDIKFHPFSLISARRTFSGSSVGGVKHFKQMFQLAAEKGIESKVQVYPLDKVNEAIKDFEAGKPRFRFVLEISKE
eukprot:TRINITY_DN11430_c0_g1_i1.p1 TRINITY_DN11430_c0_g1~~TRINITY_DN11430_c0_g1_i1.p1  ORF type:complete len:362 (-),score=102.92 TRINITY_DN11430_c0_g1_i1:64-1119(-)